MLHETAPCCRGSDWFVRSLVIVLIASQSEPRQHGAVSRSATQIIATAPGCYTPGMSLRPLPGSMRASPVGRFTILIALAVLLFGAGTIAGYVIEYQWWQEMGQ